MEGGEGLGGVHQGPRGGHTTSPNTHVELQEAMCQPKKTEKLEECHAFCRCRPVIKHVHCTIHSTVIEKRKIKNDVEKRGRGI